ncbi:MAG: hypothetical protein Q4G64_05945 [bacterium]|nr:hypothetical protein [bacterium]
MSKLDIGSYMEHPLVQAYLRDLDIALSSVRAREAGEIRESIREHLLSEFTAPPASENNSVGAVVTETLRKLGTVDSIVSELREGELQEPNPSASENQWRASAVLAVSALGVVLLPFAAGVSAVLSTVALVLAAKYVSTRARTPLIIVNSVVLLAVLAYLVIALITGDTLFGTVQGAG